MGFIGEPERSEGIVYLASPYTPGPHVPPGERVALMQQRFNAACDAAGALIARGHLVYSPIAHGHPIAARAPDLGLTFEDWRRHNEAMLAAASELWILALAGWSLSTGIADEMAWWARRGAVASFRIIHPTEERTRD